MKFFTTSTFAALTSLFFVLATVQATVLPRDGILPPPNLPPNLIPEYFMLLAKCNANDATVAVLYEGGAESANGAGVCTPRSLDGVHPAQLGVFCRAVTCSLYQTYDCTGDPTLPINIPYVAGEAIVNPFDVTASLTTSVMCQWL